MSARVTEPIDLDTIAVGDHVTSRWTLNGAIWAVTHVGWIQRPALRAHDASSNSAPWSPPRPTPATPTTSSGS